MGGSAIVLTVVFLSGLLLATPFSLLGLVMRFTPREREAGVLRVFSERFRVWRQKKQAQREKERLTEVAEQLSGVGRAQREGLRRRSPVNASSKRPKRSFMRRFKGADDNDSGRSAGTGRGDEGRRKTAVYYIGLFGSNEREKPVVADPLRLKGPTQATIFKAAVKVNAGPQEQHVKAGT